MTTGQFIFIFIAVFSLSYIWRALNALGRVKTWKVFLYIGIVLLADAVMIMFTKDM